MFAAFAALDEALDSAVNTLDVGGTFADLEKHIDADIGDVRWRHALKLRLCRYLQILTPDGGAPGFKH